MVSNSFRHILLLKLLWELNKKLCGRVHGREKNMKIRIKSEDKFHFQWNASESDANYKKKIKKMIKVKVINARYSTISLDSFDIWVMYFYEDHEASVFPLSVWLKLSQPTINWYLLHVHYASHMWSGRLSTWRREEIWKWNRINRFDIEGNCKQANN